MFGIPVVGPTHRLCDNESVVKNGTIPELTLQKKHNSIVLNKCPPAPAHAFLLHHVSEVRHRSALNCGVGARGVGKNFTKLGPCRNGCDVQPFPCGFTRTRTGMGLLLQGAVWMDMAKGLWFMSGCTVGGLFRRVMSVNYFGKLA